LLSLPCFGNTGAARAWFRYRPGGWIYTNLAATALACLITRRLAGRWLPRLLKDLPRAVAEDLVKHHVVSSTSSLWEVVYRYALFEAVASMPAEIPIHFIHGQADDTAPLAPLRDLTSDHPSRRLSVLEGVDHHPWLRSEAICRQLIADALACD
jgi:pimeloyl-ACP methyl ester carboxylesterase